MLMWLVCNVQTRKLFWWPFSSTVTRSMVLSIKFIPGQVFPAKVLSHSMSWMHEHWTNWKILFLTNKFGQQIDSCIKKWTFGLRIKKEEEKRLYIIIRIRDRHQILILILCRLINFHSPSSSENLWFKLIWN